MRDSKTTGQLINAITGIAVGSDATGVTCNGVSIDTLGFADILLVVMIGSVVGTAAAPGEFVVQLQDSEASTGPFTLISNGQVNGTCTIKVNVKGHSAVTEANMYMVELYERLRDVNRKRYVRVLATLKGTSGANIAAPFAVGAILGHPQDTLWINNATSVGTGNTGFYAGFQNLMR